MKVDFVKKKEETNEIEEKLNKNKTYSIFFSFIYMYIININKCISKENLEKSS